MVLREHT